MDSQTIQFVGLTFVILVAVFGYFIRLEKSLTAIETRLKIIMENCKKCPPGLDQNTL